MNEAGLDGRKLMEEVYLIAKDMLDNLDTTNYAGKNIEKFRSNISEAAQWAKKSKSKVWLRTKEGTERTNVVLDAAKECRDNFQAPEIDSLAEKFSTLASELGNELYYKVSIIT